MKTFLNWSGGKDSALCLQAAQQQGIKSERLLTCLHHNRISMHGVSRMLLERQCAALGLPLSVVELPDNPSMADYEGSLHAAHAALKAEGFTDTLYGDLFLEDLRQYREGLLQKDGLRGHYPLWGSDTAALAQRFVADGFRAVIVSVNESFLPRSFCGRAFDDAFLHELPAGVDPCGENGEFHTFVWDGPVFLHPVAFERGAIIQKSYPAPRGNDDCFTDARPETVFSFCELLP
ncbi:ATP-binding protein [Flaviaesturariibacter flavus]|uniref:ATP-binding protein n=1 Tax=Flaviaesturariibacter flavus TaxID=2502780 RepID=A0A4R1BB90_9BACT|nr:ATP-binding protein [Flaviaesturariibacter flavus]TCJ14250.1 ATP-binding protein [Flaviaesturariibacter flavus]